MNTVALLRCVLALVGAFSAVAAQAETWKQLFVFGDSYFDSGAGYVDGNGPTAVVYLAQCLNIPFTHAQDPERAGKGLNFAVSGAQTGWGDGEKSKAPCWGWVCATKYRTSSDAFAAAR